MMGHRKCSLILAKMRGFPINRSKGRVMTLVHIDSEQLDSNTVVLSVKGDLDAFSVFEFRQAAALHRESPKLIIELGTTFLDSAGLNALVGAVRQVREQRRAVAVVGNPRIAELLTTSGFDRVVRVSGSVDEARTALA